MFSDQLVINDGLVNHTFVKNASTPTGSKRIEVNTSLDAPTVLVIDHGQTGSSKAGNLAYRHLLQCSDTEVDINGKPSTLVINITVNKPAGSTISDSRVKMRLTMLTAFLAQEGVVEQLLRNES